MLAAARMRWLLLLLAYYSIQWLAAFVPAVGPLVMMIGRPVFTVGFLAAAWTQQRGGVPHLTSIVAERHSQHACRALMIGLILSRGRPTITAALRAAGPLAHGHFATYHRVFSRASWSTWLLGL